ncbi:unnamed protein product [Clavelina lepadiformis]|uniref:Uncharacterized protein n=1 Tax=Clavelina lepadiformis TaxID=159417 RepID=A0ABP0FCR1_CLALP
MKTGIDKVLTRYISSEMECTSTLACRVNPSTSLKLSILPSRADMETDDWRKVFEVNLNGLQDFNLYLHRMLSEDSERTTLSEANQDVLRQVWNTVNQFMFFFKHHMEDIFCFEINVEPFELYPPCHSCGQNIPPSRSLEIVRNYQFMMQFYSYLDGFSNLYNKFLLRANVPDRCG